MFNLKVYGTMIIVSSMLVLSGCSNDVKITTDSDGNRIAKHELFEFKCSSDNKCMRTAQKNIIQIDGIFVDVNNEFMEKCVENKLKNKYCSKVIKLGTKTNFSSSQRAVDNLLNNGINPKIDDSMKSRIKSAYQKIYKLN